MSHIFEAGFLGWGHESKNGDILSADKIVDSSRANKTYLQDGILGF